MKVVMFERAGSAEAHCFTDQDGEFSLEVDVEEGDVSDGRLVVRDPVRGGEVIEETTIADVGGGDGSPTEVSIVVEREDPTSHGTLEHRGFSPDALDGEEAVEGRFVRGFPDLPPYRPSDEFLKELGREGGPLHEEGDQERSDAGLPAGYPIFGQFIDHEITLDLTSSLEKEMDPMGLENFRTPRLDLDSMYGDGEEGSAFLYDEEHEGKLLLKRPEFSDLQGAGPPEGPFDLQRNRQDRAIIVDPRNDENLVLSQMLVAFIRFHNNVVDYIRTGAGADREFDLVAGEEGSESGREEVLEVARRLVRYHYQWAVRFDFLPSVCDQSILEDIERNGRRFLLNDRPAIPIEFAAAGYRYGHSRIRDEYEVNGSSGAIRLFPDMHPDDTEGMGSGRTLRGFDEVSPELVVDWRLFFEYGGPDTQKARKIDPRLSDSLFTLPFVDEDGVTSLATRNLLRGSKLGLPSGQSLARAMGFEPISNDDLPTADGTYDTTLRSQGRALDTDAPAWYYVLAEAEHQADGEQLGAVGSRIVGEVIHGLLNLDGGSVFCQAPENWTPVLPSRSEGDDYTIADIMAFSSRKAPDGLRIVEVRGEGEEKAVLEHTGEAPINLGGYTIAFGDGEREELTVNDSGAERELEPGETLDVHPGRGTNSEDEVYLGLRGGSPVIADTGDTVTVRNEVRAVSDSYRFEG